MLSTFNLGENTTLETEDDGRFGHDEADVTMISYVLQAASCGQGAIRVLSDDTANIIIALYMISRQGHPWSLLASHSSQRRRTILKSWPCLQHLPTCCDVIRCQCRAQGKKCSTEACGCHKQHLSCTSYCNCSGGEDCCNPYTNRQVAQAGDEEGAEMEDIQAEDFEDGFDQDSDDAMDDLAIFDDLDEWE